MPKFLIAIAFALATGGCGVLYKVDIYQGNLLEAEAVEQLKPGLTKRQVFALLGSPSIRDPFHASRWDYVASQRKRGGKTEVKALVLTFEGDLLATVEGEHFPENDEQLMRDMRRYGNLPREDRDRRRRGG